MLDGGDIPARVMLDAEGRVAGDLACRQCGYNLRTLHKGAKCPECGMPVEQSWRGDWLVYSDPAWLAKLAQGLELVFWAMAVPFILLILGMIGAILSGIRVPGPGADVVVLLVVVAFLATAGVLLLIGFWRLTTPEPDRTEHAAQRNVRVLIRVCACVFLLTIPAGLIFRASWWVGWGIGFAWLLSSMCCVVALLVHLRRLAARIPSEKEARAVRSVLIWLCIGVAVTVLGNGAGFSKAFLACMIVIGGCIDTIAFLLFVLLLDRVRRVLSEIADKARRKVVAEAAMGEGNASGSGQV